jgi:hypothetical protein
MKIHRLLSPAAVLLAATVAQAAEPVEIGSRLELFVDDHLIDRIEGAELRVHRPQPRELAIVCDQPWERRAPGPTSVLFDGERYRMYYRGMPAVDRPPNFTCYAESPDGKTWTKPEVGLWEYDGSKQNNIVWPTRPGGHNLAVFIDANPDPTPGEPSPKGDVLHGPRPERWHGGGSPPQNRPDPNIIGKFKAIGGVIPLGIHTLKSDDGIRWTYAHPHHQPIINGYDLDSQNTLRHWRSRTNTVAWGVVETEPDTPGTPSELSIYVSENTPEGGGLRRYAYRMDGFVSVQAPLSGGEVVTRPLVFEGEQLVFNVSTSAAGSVRV